MPDEKTSQFGVFLPASLMYFCSGQLMHLSFGVDRRLLAILLTGGEAHDCPVAQRLIRRAKPAKRMLGDKAYDSAELREELMSVEPSRSFQIAATGNNHSASANAYISYAGASRVRSTG